MKKRCCASSSILGNSMRGLAYAAAGHSVAPSSRRTAPATSANDVVAASDGARSRHGVRYHRAAGCQCCRTIRLVRTGHRAGARRCAPVTPLIWLVSKTFAGAIHQRRIRPIVPACFLDRLEPLVAKGAGVAPALQNIQGVSLVRIRHDYVRSRIPIAIHIETCVEARRDRIAPSGRKEGQSISERFPRTTGPTGPIGSF
jgi:hypothetical protein